MRKMIILLAVVVGISSTTKAQYSKGDNNLSVGIGVGSPFFGSGYSASLPVNPTATFEHGFTDDISAGATVSYASSKIDDGFGDEIKFSATYIGVRGSYHFDDVLNLNKSKIDVYGGVGLGYVVESVSDNEGDGYTAASGIGYALYVGGRYYFAPKAAVYAELGYASLSVLNAGVSFKF